jgi:hypothetical protein
MLCMAESLRFGIVSTSDMYYFMSDMAKAVADSGTKNNLSRSIVNFDGTEFHSMEAVQEMKDKGASRDEVKKYLERYPVDEEVDACLKSAFAKND